MRNTQPLREPDADQPHLFMRVNRVVPLSGCAPEDREEHQAIEHDLGERRSNPDAPDEWRPQASEDTQVRKLDVSPDGIGDEIDVMAELAERFDAVVFA